MNQTAQRKWGKKMLSLVLAGVLTTSIAANAAPHAYAAESIAFKTQNGGVFDGMPLFDGNPDHLDAYVDRYFEYTGLEGPAVYVTGSRNHYTLTQGANAGKVIPGALAAADNVQGVSTDFPALVGMGQTWNKELLANIGKVMGNEKISLLKVKQGESNIHGGANASATVAFTVVSDMRINPLSGRFDEGYSEDPYMAGTLIDEMASGLSGIDQSASEDGFWMRAAVGTKHYSVYNAQWFRETANNSASARAMFEYQTRSPLKGFESGSIAGVMTSFGRTNGIPNILSPLQLHANDFSKYGVYSSPDFNGDAHVSSSGNLSNGYDTNYAVDRTHATVLMALAEANAGRPSGTTAADVPDLVALVNKGEYGITAEDLITAARPHVNQMVRVGIFNEVDDNGIPKFYPFAQDAKDVRTAAAATYSLPEHQQVALQAAQESIVLLKNDGVLPLAKNKNAAVSGVYADARFKTTYSVGTTPVLPQSGISPLLAIINANGANHVSYDSAGKVIALTAVSNNQTVTANVYDPNVIAGGAQLVTTEDPLNPADSAHLFQVFDWGQEGSSLLSLKNNRWVTSPTANNAVVGNTDATRLNLTDNDWDLAAMLGNTSAIPPRLRIENNADQTISLVANGYRSGFSGDFTNWYYANGRFITTGADAKLKTAAAVLGNASNAANRSADVKFKETVVKEVGQDSIDRAAIDDYAVVFVGAVPRHSAGEGNDRSSLYMGDADYELVDNVSAAFAAKGKKTIVVVKSSFPVGLEDIQNNPNVSAIVYQPYGGQYDSHALAQVLYGDYAPTGRLTSTWYADMSAFPAINKYVVPEGNKTASLATIDPRFTLDMTNADPIESKLTYMYTDASVTYPFGFGLSYSSFSYSDLAAPASASGNEPFTVSVNVKNEGTIATSEVVQLYIKNKQSGYGESAPKQQLVGFEKVQLAAGESKTVSLSVDANDFGIWDVNKNSFIVEEGSYTLMVGSSSQAIHGEKNIQINGDELAALQVFKPFNVFDHAFATNEVIYHEVSKERTAQSLKAKKVVGEYYAVRSKQNGSYAAISNVDLTGTTSVSASVASDGAGGIITLHADTPNSAPIAMIEVPATQPVSYTIANASVPVTELGYVDVTADLSNTSLKGKHTLYVVFKAADLRIDSLAFVSKSVVSTSSTMTAGQANPIVVINSDSAPFSAAASNIDNWSLETADSGITLASVEVAESGLQATLTFSGTAKAATVSVQAKAASFDGNVEDSNKLSLTIAAASSSGGGGGGTTVTPATPVVTVTVATAADMAKVKNIQSEGVTVASAPVAIKVSQLSGSYAAATVTIEKDAGQKITALALVADDGTLTPVPSKITTDASGKTVIKALVSTSGTYVAVSSDRQFTDVAAAAWYAGEIAKANSLLLINGVTASTMQPGSPTTKAQTLMVALNVLGISPDKNAEDARWYDAVVRAASKHRLVSYSALTADTPMSREDMAAVLAKALQHAGIAIKLSDAEVSKLLQDFSDAASISQENRAAMAIAVKYGIFKGNPSQQLQPDSTITRAELAAVALRTQSAIVKLIS
ncbi:glycoside hydrolase family 3 C-terminal domain-containing protein [Paenibacillus sinopodophylli]|uniref:glycoside hydrolase family 3 C-terminal domain-containing protein n=1 Tax=Paenibacillus sinopodophylli TaxID=1837342 RepID=UPI00110CAFE5|nr:glycoside hydrolase family 3 C-terminal domain-containing protein [Paenibacillus sinopodophylli]